MKNKAEKTDFILNKAFQLFLSKEYVDVTTGDLEAATGISRGSIYYRTKNKEGLYRAVINKYVFDFLSSGLDAEITTSPETPFWDFLMHDLDLIEERMKAVKTDNPSDKISMQYVNLLISACFHYKDFKKKYNEIERLISEQWLHYYNLGIKCGELRGNVSPEVVISMFRSLYYGDSFCLSITNDGLDIDALREKHILLYNAIK